MDKHHAKHIPKEPKSSQLTKIRFGDVLKLDVARNQLDDGRSGKSHQGGGSGMKPWCSRKQVDGQT